MRFILGLLIGFALGYAVASTFAGAGIPLTTLFREPKPD